MFLQFCDKCLSVNPGLVKGNWGDFKSQLSEKDKSLSATFKSVYYVSQKWLEL